MVSRLATLVLLLTVAVTPMGAVDSATETKQLDGVWKITALIDDGEIVAPTAIRERFAREGQIVIKDSILSLVNPLTLKKRDLPFVVDPQARPRTLDIAGTQKVGSKGIYMIDGDTLIVCMGGSDAKSRPTSFTSTKGSQMVLMTLQRENRQATTPAVIPAQVEVPPAQPANRDEEMRKALLGTWGHQTDDKITKVTFNADGTFSDSQNWKKGGFRRVFHEDVRSSGRWKVENGVVIVQINASTDRARTGQVYSFRITNLGATQIVATDQDGKVRVEWKVQQ